jgi:hypothetical protein
VAGGGQEKLSADHDDSPGCHNSPAVVVAQART